MSEPVPAIVGAAGLTGRPLIARSAPELDEPNGFDEAGRPVWDKPRAPGTAIPPNCLRVLHSPLPIGLGGGCATDCPGLQRDGSCLCELVRAAILQGASWSFEIDKDGFWVYDGEPLAP